MVSTAAALVTVSKPWAEAYHEKYGKPTEVVFNGFDPGDYGAEPGPGSPDSQLLRIVYTGGIYPGIRDPSPVFKALHLVEGGLDGVRLEFFGTTHSHVLPLAESCGVGRSVTVHRHVDHKKSVALQREADVLLLMQWTDPSEEGNIPGKLFEYLAARRPILGLGLETGVPASIIRDRAAGYFSNDPRAIAEQLTAWLRAKRTSGQIAPLPETVCAGFSRDEQFSKLETFLVNVLASDSR